MEQIQTKILQEIINRSESLNNLYQTLLIAKIDENKEKENETLKKENETLKKENETLIHIDIVSNSETELYNKLDLDNIPLDQLENRFSYFLRREPIGMYNKDLIKSRFLNYINELTIRNPILSLQEDIVDRIQENIAEIERQVKRDYSLTFLFLLSQELEYTNDPLRRSALLEEYLNEIYCEKSLEEYLTKFPTHPEKSGRQRCLDLCQETNLVNSTYQEIITQYLHASIEDALIYTDKKLTEYPDEHVYLKPILLSITAATMILEPEERKKLHIAFTEENTMHSYQSCQSVCQALRDGMYLDKVYQKRKVYNSK